MSMHQSFDTVMYCCISLILYRCPSAEGKATKAHDTAFIYKSPVYDCSKK